MIEFCNKKEIRIYSDIKPCVCARTILPNMSKEEVDDIKKKPFINKKNINFFVHYKDEVYSIFIPKGFTSDIASIPFGVRWMFGGKSNPYFICGAILHDIICIKPIVVNHNRYLASLILREMLIGCGYNKIKADIMFNAVELWQKTIGKKNWKN